MRESSVPQARFSAGALLASAALMLWAGEAQAVDCKRLDEQANNAGAQIPGSASGYTVTGSGRLQFYSAPNPACKMAGVFILTGEAVNAYVEYKGYTAVMYINPKSGGEAQGWVESARLKSNGYGIAPRQ